MAAARPAVLVLDPRDTVAVAVTPLQPGRMVEAVRGDGPVRVSVDALIPFGHKIAIAPMDVGDPIVKYGEVIGYALAAIRPGQHVHVHNVRSDRAGAGHA
ncbi:MAG TPA: UxaA family hydrolase [bacterium]|nr:UxaA family hydrolase [bacterium]